MSELSILQGCLKGDEKAFKMLVETYGPMLMAVCMRYMKDSIAAKDPLQETFISIFKSIKYYSGNGSFEGWMKKIAVNACIQEIRKRRPFQDLSKIDTNISTCLQENTMDVDTILLYLNDLPELHRITFNMYVVEGYSHQEIGEILQIPESSSRVYLTRARKMLQEKIESNDGEQKLIFNLK